MKLTDKRSLNLNTLDVSGIKIAVIVSRFNDFITEPLKEGSIRAFTDHGGSLDNLDTFYVPGAFELPTLAKILAREGKYDAILCLGAVIKGETSHFDYVCQAAIGGISNVSIEMEMPVLNGVITALNEEQARARASKDLNLGYEYMKSAIEMVESCKLAKQNYFAKNSSI